MTTTNHKNQIVRSLEALDHEQAQKVLDYIRGILHEERNTVGYHLLKYEALKQIRQALK